MRLSRRASKGRLDYFGKQDENRNIMWSDFWSMEPVRVGKLLRTLYDLSTTCQLGHRPYTRYGKAESLEHILAWHE